MNHTDPAWEEYLSTDNDPTGGDLDPEEEEVEEDGDMDF